MSRLVDIDNYLVLENGTIKETSFKQDIQIQNQTLMINEDAKVQIIYKTTEEGTYQRRELPGLKEASVLKSNTTHSQE